MALAGAQELRIVPVGMTAQERHEVMKHAALKEKVAKARQERGGSSEGVRGGGAEVRCC